MDPKYITSPLNGSRIDYHVDSMQVTSEIYLPRYYIWFHKNAKDGAYGYVPVREDKQSLEYGDKIFDEQGEKLAAAFKEFYEKVITILKDIEV